MRVPRSTYRLQITEGFDLRDAARTLSYLHELGADWVYLSPLLASESGSDHGYDVSDHTAIDSARGRASGLVALATEARRLGMGVLVDIVPNHVGVAQPWENEWWWHVLTHGQESPYADAFDIDWAAGDGRLLLPVVGDDDLLPGGAIDNLRVLAGELHYHDQRFPLAAGSAERGPDEDPNAIHDRQHYRLISWRDADHLLNYRRFFAVNSLVAVRVEEPEWFEKSHAEIRRWFDEGLVDGLRVDHPDGLRDPKRYLDDLAELTGGAYVLVEKILEPGEELLRSWATAGTTGYDALALIDRVLVDPNGQEALEQLEQRLRGPVDWHQMIHDAKREVADGILQAEVRRITREVLEALPAAGPGDASDEGSVSDDAAPDAARVADAVAELLACFPVYRSYLPEGREYLDGAFALARRHRPDLDAMFDLVSPVLSDGAAPAAQRFQQTSGMVMAKGVEDTSFYRWSRLTSLNEVGGDPSVFAISPEAFHRRMAIRQDIWPQAMTTSTTHDTKRSEDVRSRISVLAEMPDLWTHTLDRLLALVPAPDPGFANLLWQAVIGAWPAERERLHAYAEKAMREAGNRTQWTDVDSNYEAAVHRCVDAAFDHPEVRELVEHVANTVAGPGWSNALAAKLLTLTVPGVPDVYQGSELWEQSLVDPDNRRPVDFERRAELLADLRTGHRPALLPTADDTGAVKLLLTQGALTARREHPDWFSSYAAVEAEGDAADHLLAYDRGGSVALATRLPVGLRQRGGWGSTSVSLPPGRWIDVLTDRRVSGGAALVTTLLADYPVALLVRDHERGRGRFDVWAPHAGAVVLSVADRQVPMERDSGGWWRLDGPAPQGDVDYGYLLDDSVDVLPDPRSFRQPNGVHERSRTFDPNTFDWTDGSWTGRQLTGALVYELHVGTFTPEGTLDAAAQRLDHLRSLGVDVVELMPVNAFNGEHGWGYDGVAWGAVHESYGGPSAYQRFVDACHAVGIAVVQDVVYNHFGPSGNYLPRFGPYLSDEGDNPWGTHLNLDGDGNDGVRAYVLDNVRRWFEDFHVDGLRLDAVHALSDSSETHLLEEIAVLTARLSAHLRRPLTLIAESDMNEPRLITPRQAGGYGLDAQWSDDFHHALHVALSGETDGYYADFAPLASLAKVCERGLFHDGIYSSFRGHDHGRPIDVEHTPAWRLVVCSQNHDQVGNRARGDRLAEHLDVDQLACAALVTMTAPFTPMLFQGEEWAASTPFPYFTSHPEAELGRAVSEGRLREFERMDWDLSEVPDPQDPATFIAAKLDWDELGQGRHAEVLSVYRDLAALRRATPDLTDPDLRTTRCTVDEKARWFLMRRGDVVVAVNFGDDPATIELGGTHEVRWATPSGARTERTAVVLPPHGGALLLPLG